MNENKKKRTTVYIDVNKRQLLGIASAILDKNFTEIFNEALDEYLTKRNIKEQIAQLKEMES